MHVVQTFKRVLGLVKHKVLNTGKLPSFQDPN